MADNDILYTALAFGAGLAAAAAISQRKAEGSQPGTIAIGCSTLLIPMPQFRIDGGPWQDMPAPPRTVPVQLSAGVHVIEFEYREGYVTPYIAPFMVPDTTEIVVSYLRGATIIVRTSGVPASEFTGSSVYLNDARYADWLAPETDLPIVVPSQASYALDFGGYSTPDAGPWTPVITGSPTPILEENQVVYVTCVYNKPVPIDNPATIIIHTQGIPPEEFTGTSIYYYTIPMTTEIFGGVPTPGVPFPIQVAPGFDYGIDSGGYGGWSVQAVSSTTGSWNTGVLAPNQVVDVIVTYTKP